MGALDRGLTEEELPEIVKRWRAANKRIVDLWYTVQNCAINCLLTGQTQLMQHSISFSLENNSLAIKLPSGRKLYYVEPRIITNSFGSETMSYMGQNQTTKKWEKILTYGGKLTENLVQAIARDCLAEAIERLVNNGFRVLFHIHDEIIAEVPKNDYFYNLENAIKIMCVQPDWAKDLPLNADRIHK